MIITKYITFIAKEGHKEKSLFEDINIAVLV